MDCGSQCRVGFDCFNLNGSHMLVLRKKERWFSQTLQRSYKKKKDERSNVGFISFDSVPLNVKKIRKHKRPGVNLFKDE